MPRGVLGDVFIRAIAFCLLTSRCLSLSVFSSFCKGNIFRLSTVATFETSATLVSSVTVFVCQVARVARVAMGRFVAFVISAGLNHMDHPP